MTQPDKIFIVDAHGFLHRNYHALPRLTTSRGEEVGALYGFVRLLLKIIREKSPRYMAVCFDSPGRNFRHELYPQYKATRKETDEALKVQLSVAREIIASLGLKEVSIKGFEADDIMATIAKESQKAGLEVVLVTTDKDILQMVGDGVRVWNGGDSSLIGPSQVKEKYGVAPERLADYFALVGDSSDNVPGVRGIGPKQAQRLVNEYSSLEQIISEASPGSMDAAKLSRKLVSLDSNAPVNVGVDDCKVCPPRQDMLVEMCKRLEFKDLLALARSGSEAGVELPEISPWQNLIERAAGSKSVFIAAREDWLCIAVRHQEISGSGSPASADLLGTGSPSPEAEGSPAGGGGIPGEVSVKRISQLSDGDRKTIRTFFSSPAMLKVGHDFKTSIHALGMEFLRLRSLFDTMIAAYCINPSAGNYDFSKTAFDHLSCLPQALPLPDGLLMESKLVWRLKEELEKKLAADSGLRQLYEAIEAPLISVLAAMEKRGVGVDTDALKKLGRKLAAQMLSLQTEINDIAGLNINLNSPKRLGWLLFEKLGLPTGRKTKTGYSTNEETLMSLSGAHPAVAMILRYREASKLKSAFVDNLVEMAQTTSHGASGRFGRLHTSLDQTGTSTGRLSSARPNLQNIPARSPLGQEIRRGFVPEEGSVFLSADYSQIDLRVLAHTSGDEALIESFLRGEDIHLKTACEVFHLKPSQIDGETRRKAKAINFGIVYGQTASGLSRELGISREEARNYINHYFSVYSGVARWIGENLDAAKKSGFVCTLTGRRRYLPELNSSNGAVRAFAERAAVNTPIQGGSADIIKKAMLDIHSSGVKMILQVHDELLFEVPGRDLNECARIVKAGMENAFSLKVPLLVDLKTGGNWQDMERMKA